MGKQKQGPFTSNFATLKSPSPNLLDNKTASLELTVSDRQEALPVREHHMSDRQEAQPVRDYSTRLASAVCSGNLAGFVFISWGLRQDALGILCVLAFSDKKSVYFLRLMSFPSFSRIERIDTVTRQY